MELLPFVDILKVFNNPINEEQAWAVCFQCAYFLFRNPTQESYQDVYDSGIHSIWLSRHGDVLIRKGPQEPNGSGKGPPPPSPGSKHAPHNIFKPKRSVIASETDAVQALGTAIFEALDFGIEVTEERQLSPGLESLIVAMTLADSSIDVEYESQNADDEGIEKDADVEHRCTVAEVIRICSQHLSSKQDAHHHFKAVCRALATEAGELFTFLDKISSGREKLSETIDDDSKRLEELQRADWACLWVQVMRSLRQGVRLKKIEHVHHPPLEYELTPFEMILEDIRSRRYTLHKIMVNGDIPHKVKNDAHAVILNFIRSRPPLRKVDERKLKPKPTSPPDPHEQLLRQIRSQPKLRPVRQGKLVVETSRTRLNDEDELEPALPVKRVIKADLNLLLNSSFEESSDDDEMAYNASTPSTTSTTPSPPQPSSSSAITDTTTSTVNWRRAAARDALMSESNAQRPSKLQRRHTIMVCESPIDGKVQSGELPTLAEEEDEPSPIKESHSLVSLRSGHRPNPSHPLVPKPSLSDHDLQGQVILRQNPGQNRRLSLEHRRSLTSLPIGLSAIPEMDDSGNGTEGSPGSRPCNLLRKSWSTEQAPPPNPSPPCKARVRASASMSMAGSRPRSNLSHPSTALRQQKSISATAATSAASQSVQNASCMSGGGGRPPSFFSNASLNLKNSENGSSRHASRGPGLTRQSSLPSTQHASMTSRSSIVSSVSSSSSCSSSSPSHTPSSVSSSASRGTPPVYSLSSSSSSSSVTSSPSKSSSQPSSEPKSSGSGNNFSSSNASDRTSLDKDSSCQSPFFSRSIARIAAAAARENGAEANKSTHTVIEPTAQRQARWRNPNAREERMMRRQARSGIPSCVGGDTADSTSPSSSPHPLRRPEMNSGDKDSEESARPRRLSLDGGVSLYRDAPNVTGRNSNSPVIARSPLTAFGRRLSVGTKNPSDKQQIKSPEERERVSRWRALQEDDLEERIKSKSPRSGTDNADLRALENRFAALSVAIPENISEEDDHSALQQPISSPSSISSQERTPSSSQPPSITSSPRPGRFFKSNQSRISPSGQRLLCESPDALKQQMATEEARLSRWRRLEETAASELEYVSGHFDPGSSLDHASSSDPSSPNSPVVSIGDNPIPAPHFLAETLVHGKTTLPKRWENPIECLSLTLEEVTHIRSVLTKAELESLISHPDLYQQVAKSKLCFTCKTVRFSLFGEWGTKCKFCRRTVCSKCLRKMHVPTDHFRNIPVYTLSPTPLGAEMEEFIRTYIKKAPPASVPATRDASPSRNHQLPPPSSTANNTQTSSISTTTPSSDKPLTSEDPASKTNFDSASSKPGSNRSIFNKSALKPLHRSQSAMTPGQKPGTNLTSPSSVRSVKGPLMAICCDCKGMIMEIIRASRTSLAIIMNPGSSSVSPPNPSKGTKAAHRLVSQSFRY